MDYKLTVKFEKYDETISNLTCAGWTIASKAATKAVLKKKFDKYFIYVSNF